MPRILPLTQLKHGIKVYENNSKKWDRLINMSMKHIDQVLTSSCPCPGRSKLKLDIAKNVIQMETTLLQHNNVSKNEVDFKAVNNIVLYA